MTRGFVAHADGLQGEPELAAWAPERDHVALARIGPSRLFLHGAGQQFVGACPIVMLDAMQSNGRL